MSPGTQARPLRVAIVGAGPSGFYAAAALLAAKDLVVEVDLIDRLPTPFGLVRGGVAPDHQKIKNVVRAYEKTASDPRFRFYGNVRVGQDISVATLRELYDQVCFAVGCESSNKLGIPGEDLAGSTSATEFVGWYNAHPDYEGRTFDLSARAAVVVGVGNVSMDVTRILAQDPARLQPTDISEAALDALRAKRITDVYVLGRRGPAQAAFSPGEIKEIGDLEEVDLILPERSYVLDPASAAAYEAGADKQTRQTVEYLQQKGAQAPKGAPVRVHLLLCTSPVEVLGSDGKMTGVKVEINELFEEAGGRIGCRGTGRVETLDAQLMFRSVGYRGVPLPGLPFDDRRGIVANDAGRVRDGDAVMTGVYVVGWAKRGPSGLIGTNRADSVATVELMLADAAAIGTPDRTAAAAAAAIAAACPGHTTWSDWERLDALERATGEASGRVRTKFPTVSGMLAALDR